MLCVDRGAITWARTLRKTHQLCVKDGAPLWVPPRAARGPGRAAASSGSALRARKRVWCCYRGRVGLRAAEEGLGPVLPHHLFAQKACVRGFAPSSEAGQQAQRQAPAGPSSWGMTVGCAPGALTREGPPARDSRQGRWIVSAPVSAPSPPRLI